MNLSRVKVWTAEILYASDLNAEFNNIIDHEIANADIAVNAAIEGAKLKAADIDLTSRVKGILPVANGGTGVPDDSYDADMVDGKHASDIVKVGDAAGGDLEGTYPDPTVVAEFKKGGYYAPDSTCILAYQNATCGVDLSSLHNAITLYGNVEADLYEITPKIGFVYNMDGANDYSLIAHHALQAGMAAFTIEAWCYRSTKDEYSTILSNKTDNYIYLYWDTNNTHLYGVFQTSSGNETFNVAHGLDNGGQSQYIHVVVTWASVGPSKLYINGVYKGSGDGAGNGTISDSANGIYIGAASDASKKFQGYCGGVRFLRREMAVAEILARYNTFK